MLNQARVHEVENGLRVNDGDTSGPIFTGGPASPVGLDFPVGTYYVQNVASGPFVWKKWNVGVNDWIKVQSMDFYQSLSALPETSTTSQTTFLNKLTLTTPSLPLGNYRLGWKYDWRTSGNRLIDVRIQRNAADIFLRKNYQTVNDELPYGSGFLPIDAISGIQTFTLDFKVGGNNTTVYMQNAYFEFWRIS